jgi:hypothetical protein
MSIKKLMASLAVIAAAVAVGVAVSGIARADRHGPAVEPGSRTGIVSHRATDDPQKVRDYWTPDRMRKAHPAPMPTVGD